MGKSSSSSKKIKHSKDSSKLRSVKKKKTKRSKSKKIRRIRDYSDESESSGSDSSLYSSSSEDDYRREKRRSKVSKKKKRPRKRYSSSESDDDDDGDTRLLKKKKRSKRKEEHLGTKKKKKVSSRKRRKRDSSSSSTGSDNESGDGSESDLKRRTRDRGRVDKVKAESEEEVEDEVMTEKSNSRRLKSIVVVSYSYGNDERKEDMVDDHDDESCEDKIVDDGRDGDDESGRKAFGYDEFEKNSDSSETSKGSYPENSLKDEYDDLEAILKQRALENLKKFRGETLKSGKARKEASSLQTESETTEKSQDHSLMEQKLFVSAESKDLETSQKTSQVVDVDESGTGLANLASQQDRQSGDTAKVKASSGLSSCTTKRKLIRPVLGQESLNLASRKEDAEAESISGSTLDKNVPESSLTLARKNGAENIEQTEEVSSTLNTETLDEIKGGGSQPEQKTNDETKDESQYEKKTMTVMRGGEMVQVSYKVYIPKKTSSLGRRQLKR